jgi:long-chain acyl-CoA synthetase
MIGFETRLAGPDGDAVETGQAGEILIRGAGNMDGYWNDAESTAQCVRGGWIATGDGGRRDGAGRLYITDRIKDMIITGGENVYSVEVEVTLLGHPAIAECAVVAIADRRLGERVHAVVVFHAGAEASIEDLDRHCRAQLGGYKRPRSWSVVPGLPRNAMGKVSKAELRDLLHRLELPVATI